jgi:hypothetical protein
MPSRKYDTSFAAWSGQTIFEHGNYDDRYTCHAVGERDIQASGWVFYNSILSLFQTEGESI